MLPGLLAFNDIDVDIDVTKNTQLMTWTFSVSILSSQSMCFCGILTQAFSANKSTTQNKKTVPAILIAVTVHLSLVLTNHEN